MYYSDATPDVAYIYDSLGRQKAAQSFLSATGVSIFSTTNIYSGLDLASEIQNGVVINRRQDALGRNVGFDLGAEYGVAYGYDEFGRFSCVTSTVGTEITGFDYAYLPGTDLVAGMTNSAGQSWSRSFEQNRDLITAVSNFWESSTVSSFGYSNDALGRRTARTDFNGSVVTPNAFGYNQRSEVTNAVMGANTYGYEYDPIGNRITAGGPGASSTYSANALNQYTSVADGVTVVPGYDADGNMTSYGPWAYTWDAENRLANVFSNGVLIAANAYDHRSRRIRKTVGDDVHIFLYDGWNMTAELTVNTATFVTNITCYGWGLDLSGSLQGAGGVGGLLSVTTVSLVPAISLNTYYPAFDANGNATTYLASTSSTAATFEYDAFGNTISETVAEDLYLPFRFSTKYWDAETGLSMYQLRAYSPALGRWVNRDLIDEKGGLLLYGFVGNDGVSFWDLLGWTKGDKKSEKKCPCKQEDIDKEGRNRSNESRILTLDTKNNVKKGDLSFSVEYGGRICCKKDGSVYSTLPYKGSIVWQDNGWVATAALTDEEAPRCADGDDVVGLYHSHPTESGFSPSDEKNSCIYLSNTKGYFCWRHLNGETCYWDVAKNNGKGAWVCTK